MSEGDYKEFMRLLNTLSDHLDDFTYIQDAYTDKSFIFFPTDFEGERKGWVKYSWHPAICAPSKGGAENWQGTYKDVMSGGGYSDDLDACAIMLSQYDLSDSIRDMYVDDYYTFIVENKKIKHLEDLLDEFNLIQYPEEDEGVAGDAFSTCGGVPAKKSEEQIKEEKQKVFKCIKEQLDKYLKNPNYSLPGKWLVYWRT